MTTQSDLVERGVEQSIMLRDRDVDDRQIEQGHEQPQAEDRQRGERVVAPLLAHVGEHDLPGDPSLAQLGDGPRRLAPVARQLAVDAQPPVRDQAGQRGQVLAERLLAGLIDEEPDQTPELPAPAKS